MSGYYESVVPSKVSTVLNGSYFKNQTILFPGHILTIC